ncbi:acylphosphatase [Cryptosporidium ubiquitum]|uniref:Acylphosphatase n=1 Tax=Cryptosporidium ubiquitum TaxID=857276 RepID=A0A1J4MGS6_9CRYT|nr:acylphosphatase [Cryptosporidium ubiquitum]OII73408.1 acylphosphatase [Cryptosporidium ubiquitum]
MLRCEFEVFGKVQGVSFRKYTFLKANELDIFGWCKNTSSGTVIGELEGDEDSVLKMIDFLKKEGSPGSVINKCVVSNSQTVTEHVFDSFRIKM